MVHLRTLSNLAALALLLPAAAVAQAPAGAEAGPAKGERKWRTEAELGMSTASGNTESSTVTGRIASDRKGGKATLHLLAEGLYAEDQGKTTTQRLHGLSQLDYDLRPRVYAFGVVEATNDRFAGFDLRLQEAVGLGRRLMLHREDMEWRVEAGPALRQEWLVDDTYENSVNARARTLFRWELAEESAFSEELIWTQSVQDGDDFLVMNETALSFRLNTRVALRLSVRVEHDSQPPLEAERTDVFTTTSLLVSF